jgi:hypothetical protein
MISKKTVLRAVSLAALLAVSGASQAALTVYTSLAAFNAVTVLQGTDQYNGFLITGSTPSPINRSTQVGTLYSYTAAASTSSFFGAGTTGNPWLSTNLATDSITFTNFSGGINSIGGNFFGSDINGAFLAGDVTLTVTDSLGATSTVTITGATTSSFRGWQSSGAGTITSLTISAVQTASPLWPTVDNLVLAVPEPGTYAMMLAGLGAVSLVARRRRAD